MKTFAFFFPAKIITAQYALELERVSDSAPIYAAPEGWRYYFAQDKQRVAKDKADGSRMLFVEVAGIYCPLTSTPSDSIPDFCERRSPFVMEALQRWAADLAD